MKYIDLHDNNKIWYNNMLSHHKHSNGIAIESIYTYIWIVLNRSPNNRVVDILHTSLDN